MLSPFAADAGIISLKSYSFAPSSISGKASALLLKSTLFINKIAGFFAALTKSNIILSSGVIPFVTSRTKIIRSTSGSASFATCVICLPSRFLGLWIPGVSTNITCASSRVSIPCILLRVVSGFRVTIATFSPTRRLSIVDLPTFGLPIIAANPDLNSFFPGAISVELALV